MSDPSDLEQQNARGAEVDRDRPVEELGRCENEVQVLRARAEAAERERDAIAAERDRLAADVRRLWVRPEEPRDLDGCGVVELLAIVRQEESIAASLRQQVAEKNVALAAAIAAAKKYSCHDNGFHGGCNCRELLSEALSAPALARAVELDAARREFCAAALALEEARVAVGRSMVGQVSCSTSPGQEKTGVHGEFAAAYDRREIARRRYGEALARLRALEYPGGA